MLLCSIAILELISPDPHDSIQAVIHFGKDLFNFSEQFL